MRSLSMSLMVRLGTVGFAAVLAASGPAHAAAQAPTDASVDAVVVREHAAGRFDGIVLVGRGDEIVYRRAIGWADRALRREHRVGATWRWASVSKQVAALLTMQLVEKGRLSLEDSLDLVLPTFAAPRAAQISLRDLLKHTSGLPNPDDTAAEVNDPMAVPGFYSQAFTQDRGPVDAALSYCAGPPLAQPGERFAYNNCDTLVLQAVLERATGKPYAALLVDEVAVPLGLTRLAFVSSGPPTVPAADTVIGLMADGSSEPAFNLAAFGAPGAITGTAEELWRFDRALMRHRLLGAEATRTMWDGDPRLGYVALGAWRFEARLAGCAGPVMLVERRGEIGGVQVRNLLAPDRQAALIVFSNNGRTEFGELWKGSGLGFELASAAFCGATSGERSRRRAPGRHAASAR